MAKINHEDIQECLGEVAVMVSRKMSSGQPDDLSKFICYLHNDAKLAPRTIAVHKSAVVTFANHEKPQAFSGLPLVKQLMKAISITKPPSRKPCTWEVAKLIISTTL